MHHNSTTTPHHLCFSSMFGSVPAQPLLTRPSLQQRDDRISHASLPWRDKNSTGTKRDLSPDQSAASSCDSSNNNYTSTNKLVTRRHTQATQEPGKYIPLSRLVSSRQFAWIWIARLAWYLLFLPNHYKPHRSVAADLELISCIAYHTSTHACMASLITCIWSHWEILAFVWILRAIK